jgi:hypothetical protein
MKPTKVALQASSGPMLESKRSPERRNNRIPTGSSGKPAFMHVGGDHFHFLAKYAQQTDQDIRNDAKTQVTAHSQLMRGKISWGLAEGTVNQNRAKEETRRKNTATSTVFPLSVGLDIGCLEVNYEGNCTILQTDARALRPERERTDRQALQGLAGRAQSPT